MSDSVNNFSIMKKNILTPIKSIRANCLDCCCGSCKEVRLCTVKNCDCYPYRMGTRPSKATLESMEAFYEENPEYSGGFQTKTANPKDTEDK